MKRVNLNNSHRPKRQCTIKNDPIEYPYIVVVIDMQPLFKASNNSQTLEACKGLIQQAIKDSAYIIIAQYMRNGRTHQSLTSLLKEYHNKSYAIASKNDKSDAILTQLTIKKIKSQKFLICGVNTDACVLATVEGLATKTNADIQVCRRACNSLLNLNSDFSENLTMHAYKTMLSYPNVVLD